MELLHSMYCIPKLEKPEIKLRDWQESILEKIKIGFIKRQILWVWSEESSMGKSTFMDYLLGEFGAESLLIGSWKEADLLHAYNNHKIIAFNIPRKQDIHQTMITILEKVSDGGGHLSTKYNSKMKILKAVIIVFANIPPPEDLIPKRCIDYCIDPIELINKRKSEE